MWPVRATLGNFAALSFGATVLAVAVGGGSIGGLPHAAVSYAVENYSASFSRQVYDFEPYGTTTINGSGMALPPLFFPDLQISGVFLSVQLLALGLVSLPSRRQAGVHLQAVISWLLAVPYLILSAVLRAGPIPRHVAFIMDGNRRWAKEHNMKTITGHNNGYKAMVDVLVHCKRLGVEVVTVYAFSIENFKRSKQEVDCLMELAMSKFEEAVSRRGELHKHQVRVRVLGDLSLLSPKVQAAVGRVSIATRDNTGPLLNVCLSYTSQWELESTVGSLCDGVAARRLLPSDIDVSFISRCLYTADAPAPELLVRTSGETRLSDFLLWQCALSQLSWVPTLWPSFGLWHLIPILLKYQHGYSSLEARRAHHARLQRDLDWARDLRDLRQAQGDRNSRGEPVFQEKPATHTEIAALCQQQAERRARQETYIAWLEEERSDYIRCLTLIDNS